MPLMVATTASVGGLCSDLFPNIGPKSCVLAMKL